MENAVIYRLPIKESIKTAWLKTHGAKATIWAAILIVAIGILVVAVIDHILVRSTPQIEPFFYFISQILLFLLQLGLMYIGIQRAQSFKIQYQQVFRGYEKAVVLKAIGLYFLQILVLLIPLLLIIISILMLLPIAPATNAQAAVPAGSTITTVNSHSFSAFNLLFYILLAIGAIATIYLSIRMSFAIAFVIDKTTGPIDAIRLSFKITRHNIWRLIALYLLQLIFIIISIVPLGLGLIWSLPFALVLYGVIYKDLSLKNTDTAFDTRSH